MKNKILLIGIGAQKTGTTWLYDYLSLHEEVNLSPLKEIHYFDYKYLYSSEGFQVKLINRIQNRLTSFANNPNLNELDVINNSILKLSLLNNPKYYWNHLASLGSDLKRDYKVIGEITPAYQNLPVEAYKEMLSFNENVKFIFIMRDPILRAWSHINYAYRNSNSKLSHQKMFELIFSKQIDKNIYFQKSNYRSTITEIENVIGRENILYLFYEDMFNKRSVEKICSFLDLSFLLPDFKKNINSNVYSEIDISTIPTESIYSGIYDFVNTRFGKQDNWLF